MGFVQLQQLTKTSAWCEQYVQYRCLNAPIGLVDGFLTVLENSHNVIHVQIIFSFQHNLIF